MASSKPEHLFLLCLYFLTGTYFNTFSSCLPTLTPSGSVEVAENSSLTFSCDYTGIAENGSHFYIRWFADGSFKGLVTPKLNCTSHGKIAGSNYTTSCKENQQNVTIAHVSRTSNNEVWHCVYAPQNYRSNNTSIVVTVAVSSVTLTQPTENQINVTEGTPTTFVCETSPSRPEATITWYKLPTNSVEQRITSNITSATTESNYSLSVITSTLSYSPVRGDQNYKIYCKANNNGSQTVKSTYQPQLNVRYPPDGPPVIEDNTGSTYTLVENTTLNLLCVVNGGNPRPTLTWSCNGGMVRDESSGTETKSSVTWTAVRNRDGPCWCTSYHPAVSTNQSTEVNVTILYPPTKPNISIDGTNVEGTVRIIKDTTVPVTCSSSGKPQPDYTWQYNNVQPTGSNVNLSVTVNGTAKCTASNTMTATTGERRESSDIFFHVLYGPSTPLLYCSSQGTQQPISSGTIDVITGDDLTLFCSANGDPTPTYTWNGGAGQTVTVNNVQHDNLVYNCTASNLLNPDYGSNSSRSETSGVGITRLYGPQKAPTLTYTYSGGQTDTVTNNFSVVENSSFSITCNNSDSRPSPTYRWTGVKTSQNGYLDITTISRSNKIETDGISYYDYTCIVQNNMTNTCGDKRTQNGTRNENLRINVLYPATLDGLQNQSVLEGDDFTLSTTVSHGSPKETYKWSKTQNGRSTEISNTLTHTLTNVSRSDAGFYTIEATNIIQPTGLSSYNGTANQKFHLNVFYTTIITNFTINGMQKNTTVNESDTNVQFSCFVDSNPLSYMYLHADTYSGESRFANGTSTGNINYTLENATCHDMGVYSCYGKNNYTTAEVSQSHHLLVRCSPRPRYPVDEIIEFYKALGDNVTLNLTLIAYPEPLSNQYSWTKGNGTDTTNITSSLNITLGGTSLNPSLIIHRLQKSDFGQYNLMVQNEVMEYEHTFIIKSQDKPQMPLNFGLIESMTTTTDAFLTWEPGFDGGLPQTFYILYKQVTDETWNHETTVLNYTTLKGLAPDSVYQVKVYANNEEGNSSETETLTFRTAIETSPDDTTSSAIIGGAAGGGAAAVLIIIVVVLAVVFIRRRRSAKGKSDRTERSSLYRDGPIYDENGMEINQAYVSVESLRVKQPQPSSSGGDVYSQVDKTKKFNNTNPGNAYAIVEKTTKTNNAVPDNTYAVVDKTRKTDGGTGGRATGGVGDVYATPVKKKAAEPKPEKKDKKKDKKGKKGKADKKKGFNVYENATEMNVYGNDGQRDEISGENLYENREENRTQKRNLNKDGLLYADLTFENNNRGQRKLVIHGSENATAYVQVNFDQVGEPLPDTGSDGEGDIA